MFATDLMILTFACGLAMGLWLAVILRPREKPAEEDPTREADWWREGGSPPEWRP